jgi:hypothetical protein
MWIEIDEQIIDLGSVVHLGMNGSHVNGQMSVVVTTLGGAQFTLAERLNPPAARELYEEVKSYINPSELRSVAIPRASAVRSE